MVFEYREGGEKMYVGGNAYGRIGKGAKTIEIARSDIRRVVENAVNKKERAKRSKGYTEQ